MRQETKQETQDTELQPEPAKRSLIRTLEHNIEKNIEKVRQHIERSRQEALARELQADAERGELWLEAVEQERSQAREIESVEREGLRNAAESKDEAVLVAHSGNSGETLERLAHEGAYLTGVISGGGSGIEKSWLIFEKPKKGAAAAEE